MGPRVVRSRQDRLGFMLRCAVEEKKIRDETGAYECEAIPKPPSLPGLDGFLLAGHG